MIEQSLTLDNGITLANRIVKSAMSEGLADANDNQLKAIIKQFVTSALLAQEAGFDGVQIHSAHGYLLSSSLSGLINTRSDSWGGALADRAKLLLTIIREVRNAVRDHFIIAVKLNSSDFQKGGFSHAESIAVAQMLEQEGIQFVEISGGNFETPVAYQQGSSATSTQIREAYFLDYAKDIKAALNIPVMVTGGFRSRHTMDNAINNGDADLIGIGRPFIIQPDFANQMLAGEIDQAPAVEWQFPEASALPRGAALNWFCQQLCLQGQQGSADLDLPIEQGHEDYLQRIEKKTAELLQRRKT